MVGVAKTKREGQESDPGSSRQSQPQEDGTTQFCQSILWKNVVAEKNQRKDSV